MDAIFETILFSAAPAAGGVLMTVLCWWAWRVVEWPRGKIISYAKVPLPGLGPFDGRDVICTCEEKKCDRHARQPESVVVGSNFTRVTLGKIPKVQIPLYSVDERGSLMNYIGVGVRIDEWLVVPYHVVISTEVMAALIMKKDQPAEAIKIDTNKFEVIDGDVAALRMSEQQFSRLGLVKANVATVEGENIVSICSSSKEPEMSFGTLLHDKNVFGGVVFRGSTKGGFSGAAYMIGKQIAGLHLGGGIMNYGVSASYVLALLRKPEDTAEWLERVRRKRGPIKFQRSKFSPDEAVVFIGGRYHTVDMSVLDVVDVEEEREEAYMGRVIAPEINVAENLPPHYRDTVEPAVMAMNAAIDSIPKNLEAAEEISAEQAEDYLKKHSEAVAVLDEKMAIIQSLQDSVATRYREVEKMMTLIPKGDEGRKILVEENERLKVELSVLRQMKTSANVEVSSVKAIPPKVKQAKAKSSSATILDKMVASGFAVDAVVRALIAQGRVREVVADPAGGVENTVVKEDK